MYREITDFIRKTYGIEKDFIPLHPPTFIGNEKKYLNQCIDTTFVSSIGQFVNDFEIEIAKYTNSKYAIVCVNGTNALHICLKLVGVERNDEVITQALTFVATANAISYADAIPVFIDVDRDTMGLSPNALKTFLQENAEIKNGECFNAKTGRRIKACMPMHTFGHACRIEQIADICKEYNIELVEDTAEALGSKINGKHLGTFSKISAISFNGNKIITTGGGGVIITNNEFLAKKAKHITTVAKIPHKWEYVHDEIGYNYRMPNINAALGLAQLETLDLFIEKKRNLAKKYIEFFENYEEIEFLKERENTFSNYWLNAIILKNKQKRDEFLEFSNGNGVMTRPIWQLMNKMKMFENCPKGDLSNSIWLEERVVNVSSGVIV